MSLLQAIDALLAHVPDDEIIPYGSERRRQFDVLDRAVWVEACQHGLENKLSPEEPGRPSLGLTHLPGGGYLNGDFMPMHVQWWRNRLLALRALAEAGDVPETIDPGAPIALVEDDSAYVLASSTEFVGEFWLGKIAKCVI